MSITYTGLSADRLSRILDHELDDGGNPVVELRAAAGEWPLRCCLRDSRDGDRVAIIAASPFPWSSPYSACGPMAVHTAGCPGCNGSYPDQFDGRQQIVRAFGRYDGRDRSQVYDLNRLVAPGEGLREAIADVLADPRVEFVHCHNVLAGCYSFTARSTSTSA